MRKNFIIIVIISFFIGVSGFYLLYEQNDEGSGAAPVYFSVDTDELVECLKDNNVTIYGNMRCESCKQLVGDLGGYENISSFYVECPEEPERCRREMSSGFYPEINVDGHIYDVEKGYSPQILYREVGC